MRTETQPELGEQERLCADQNDRKPEWEVEQADRESDRELVEADRDAKRKQDETVTGGDPVDRVSFVVQQHPGAEQGEHGDRDVVGRVTDEMPERMTDEQTDDRHRHLEARHQQANAQALPARQSRMPSAAETANGVKPERQANKMSVSTARRRLASDQTPVGRARGHTNAANDDHARSLVFSDSLFLARVSCPRLPALARASRLVSR